MLLAITTPGLPEMVVIALIFVLLFGAKKLPELGGAIGKGIKSFKHGIYEGKADEDAAGATADPAEPHAEEAAPPAAR